MKRKTLQKISSLMIAGVLAASAGITAFAAGDDGRTTNSTRSSFSGTNVAETIVTGTSIPLTKSIVFFNDEDNSTVFEPNISFDYVVAPEAVADNGQTTVTTKDGDKVQVNTGVADGVTGTTIQFGTNVGGTATTAVTVSSDGTDVERTANLTVDLSKFSHAGVYRYKITETPSVSVTAAGLTARTGDYADTRYLDVYIKNDNNTLSMYGAVMFKSTSTEQGKDSIGADTDKTTGFGPDGTSTFENDTTVDKYKTYNIEVKKVVAGSLADKTHEFPFYVKLSNAVAGAKYTYTDKADASSAETIADTAVIEKGTDVNTSALKLKHEESIKFIGVPSNQTSDLSIDVKEWNDSFDKYTASVKVSNGTAPTVSDAEMEANSGTPAVISTFDVKASSASELLMTVTNTIKEISPTGLALRFAPFAIMGGFGVLFLVLAHKKHRKDDSDVI